MSVKAREPNVARVIDITYERSKVFEEDCFGRRMQRAAICRSLEDRPCGGGARFLRLIIA